MYDQSSTISDEKTTNSSSNLLGYSDSDYAADPHDRKSTMSNVFLLNGGAISWNSKKQRCVATSTTEAEYISLCEASKQVKWLRSLLYELEIDSVNKPTTLYGDNQAAIYLTKDPRYQARTKHIDVRYHFIRELVEKAVVQLAYCPTKDMLADGLTKPLKGSRFKDLFESMGLKRIGKNSQ